MNIFVLWQMMNVYFSRGLMMLPASRFNSNRSLVFQSRLFNKLPLALCGIKNLSSTIKLCMNEALSVSTICFSSCYVSSIINAIHWCLSFLSDNIHDLLQSFQLLNARHNSKRNGRRCRACFYCILKHHAHNSSNYSLKR